MTLQLSPSGQLQVIVDEKPVDAHVQPCFPLSDPSAYYSLLDDEGSELGLIKSAADLEPDSRAALASALPDAAFTIGVTAIDLRKLISQTPALGAQEVVGASFNGRVEDGVAVMDRIDLPSFVGG